VLAEIYGNRRGITGCPLPGRSAFPKTSIRLSRESIYGSSIRASAERATAALNIARRPKATPIHELELHASQGLFEGSRLTVQT
jgi:hypothetical protein